MEAKAQILLNAKRKISLSRRNMPGRTFIKGSKKSAYKGQKIPREETQSQMPLKQMILNGTYPVSKH